MTSVRPALRGVRNRLRARKRPPRREMDVWAIVDCPDCGEGRVDTLDVTVRARIENDDWSYRFTCPMCARRAVATTSRAAALRAVEAGAALETWRWLTEMDERASGGPPLSLVDLLDLRMALSEPDWLETLTKSDLDD
jgi:hypothetical protein